MNKTCSCCKVEKDIQEFHRCKSRYDGLHAYCKSCRSEKDKNCERLLKYRKKWYEDNKEETIKRQQTRYSEKQESVKEYKKSHYQSNKDKIKNKSKLYYEDHKNDPLFIERNRECLRKWRASHRHVVAWRSLLNTVLRKLKRKKDNSTRDMLGYSSEELRLHIEKHWLPGMNWENYGEWHIDHVQPVFTFPADTDVNLVNALSNLRPLWATTRVIDGVLYEGNLNRNRK